MKFIFYTIASALGTFIGGIILHQVKESRKRQAIHLEEANRETSWNPGG